MCKEVQWRTLQDSTLAADAVTDVHLADCATAGCSHVDLAALLSFW